MGKLTALQEKTLHDIHSGYVSYNPHTGKGIGTADRRTLNSLCKRGLVKWFAGAPHHRLTESGMDALRQRAPL